MIWRRLCEIFSSYGAERKVFKMLSWLLMPRPRQPSLAEMMLSPMMLKLPEPSSTIKELLFDGQCVYWPRNHILERVKQTGTMENGHGHHRDEDEDIEVDTEELLSKSSSPVSIVMPCTSSTDTVGLGQILRRRTRTTGPTHVQNSSDEVSCTDDGELGDDEDDDMSDEQQRGLIVTFRSNDNEEVATARLVLKQPDPVDDFLPFAGKLLRSIEDEDLKLRLMEEISHILLVAKFDEVQNLSLQ